MLGANGLSAIPSSSNLSFLQYRDNSDTIIKKKKEKGSLKESQLNKQLLREKERRQSKAGKTPPIFYSFSKTTNNITMVIHPSQTFISYLCYYSSQTL